MNKNLTISVSARGESRARVFLYALVDVVAGDSVSAESGAAGALEAAVVVEAGGVLVAVVRADRALVDIEAVHTVALERYNKIKIMHTFPLNFVSLNFVPFLNFVPLFSSPENEIEL